MGPRAKMAEVRSIIQPTPREPNRLQRACKRKHESKSNQAAGTRQATAGTHKHKRTEGWWEHMSVLIHNQQGLVGTHECSGPQPNVDGNT